MTLPAIWTPPKLFFNATELRMIQQQSAKDATNLEFDEFIEMCKAKRLDPRLKHAYLFVFNQGKKNRSAVTVISEAGYLTAANGCRDQFGQSIYRADDKPPRFVYDDAAKNELTNPLGIVSCEVAVYKHIQGEWHRSPAEVYWDERAPIGEEWVWNEAEGKMMPSGRVALDKKKTGWIKQPRTMIAKCARIAACRYAFPDEFAGLYAEEERDAIERGKIIDLTATEIMQHALKQEHAKALGSEQAIPFDFRDGKGIVWVPRGIVHDRMEAHFRAKPDAADIQAFIQQNRVGVREFVSLAKGDWIDLKERFIDAAVTEMEKREANVANSTGQPTDGRNDA